MSEMLCSFCFPDVVEIGLIGDLCLFENEGNFGLIGYDGHKGQELLMFPCKPIPDPDPECNDPAKEEEEDAWIDMVDNISGKLVLNALDGYLLVSSCIKAGWKTGSFSFWLFNHCGKMIEEFENNKQDDNYPYSIADFIEGME